MKKRIVLKSALLAWTLLAAGKAAAQEVIYPAYFEKISPITMQDDLAKILGSSNGLFEYRFADAAKSAGHVCPAVAGAWMETRMALQALYGEEPPVRGRIHVILKGSEDDGFTGAMANVIGMITGATRKQGFGGQFGAPEHKRQDLLVFKDDNSEGPMYAVFTRLDPELKPEKCVKVVYNPQAVPFKEEIKPLMEKVKKGEASAEEKARFGTLWQERVERIIVSNFEEGQNAEMIRLEDCNIADHF
ncbi:MAG: FmdE family protein [Cardiobacteriaceae bacterium]|nr:FmdE family protein [Cardiobacteriaceae bacterium]